MSCIDADGVEGDGEARVALGAGDDAEVALGAGEEAAGAVDAVCDRVTGAGVSSGACRVCAQILFLVPPRIFIEDGVAGDIEARGLRIKELVRLGPVLVADEDDFDAFVVEFGEVWAHLLDVGDTPKHFEEVYRGFFPYHAWYGVFPSSAAVGALLSRKTAVCTASPQKHPGTPRARRMLLAIATTVWFRRSTTPFCCGV